MHKKLTELTPAELASLEARMITAAVMDAPDDGQSDLFRPGNSSVN